MNRKELEEVVNKAISLANGKGKSDAVRIICDNVEAFIEIHKAKEESAKEQPFIVDEMTVHGPSVVLADRISELAPINPTGHVIQGQNSPPREYRNADEIVRILTAKAPASIEVTPIGYSDPLTLKRHISSMGTKPDGVQLSYRPTGATAETPWPKEIFWATDEEISIGAALDKMTSDATRMYAVRNGPVVTRVATMAPVEQRMNKAGDVS